MAYLDDYGDYYELGNRNWGIYIYGKDYVDGLQIEFFTNLSVTDPSGSYPIDSTLSCETGTALSGYEEYGYAFGCWYYSIDADSNITDPRAALVTGTVNITKASSGYDIELNAQDFHQHNVTFSAKGLDLIVEEASGTAVFTKRPALRTKADLNIKSPKRK